MPLVCTGLKLGSFCPKSRTQTVALDGELMENTSILTKEEELTDVVKSRRMKWSEREAGVGRKSNA